MDIRELRLKEYFIINFITSRILTLTRVSTWKLYGEYNDRSEE